jgi:hypothetical protein
MRGLRFLAMCAAATVGFGAALGTMDLDGRAADPFAVPAKVRVLVFVRTDCPISNRYAPELKRLFREFAARSAVFSMVYADPSETSANIRHHMEEYAILVTYWCGEQKPPLRRRRQCFPDRANCCITAVSTTGTSR